MSLLFFVFLYFFFREKDFSCFLVLPLFCLLERRSPLSCFFLLLLYFQAESDRRSLLIYTPADGLILAAGVLECFLIHRNFTDLLLSVTLLPLSLFLLDPRHEKIGEGDKELVFSSAFFFCYDELVFVFFFSVLFLFLYSLLRKKARFPFAPFWFLSSVLVTLCIHIPRGG